MFRKIFEIFKQENGEWAFRLRAGNNENLCHSEGHKNLRDVVDVYAIYFQEDGWKLEVDNE